MICLDTNIVYHFLFETELTSTSEKIIREAIIEGMAIPMMVYNELLQTDSWKVAAEGMAKVVGGEVEYEGSTSKILQANR